MARVSGNEKLFRLDLAAKRKTQLTFGTHDDGGGAVPRRTTRSCSRRRRPIPSQPIEPEVARNGNIYNLWTLNLKTASCSSTPTRSAAPLAAWSCKTPKGQKVAFVSYYKGEYGLHTLELKKPLHTAASADFGAPGPDHRLPGAAHAHAGRRQQAARRGPSRSCSSTAGRRSPSGVTSGGDIFGGTAISFTDVLGDQRVQRLRRRRSRSTAAIAGSYVNLSRRFQLAMQGFSQTQFFYGQYSGLFYDPAYAAYIDRDMAMATRSVPRRVGVRHLPARHLPPPRAVGGLVYYSEQYNDPTLEECVQRLPDSGLRPARSSTTATIVPLSVAFVQETTVFREFGPLSGNTMRLGYEVAPKHRQHAVAADGRRRRAQLPAAGRQRPARAAAARLQELGRVPGLHLLRRQLRDARLRLPRVRRPERRLRQRRAPLPASSRRC